MSSFKELRILTADHRRGALHCMPGNARDCERRMHHHYIHHIKPKKMKLQTINAIPLTMAELVSIEGGDAKCKTLALACGAGIALSIFTGPIGALIAGPSTIGLCIATAAC